MGKIGNQVWIGDKPRNGRPGENAEHDISDQQRLTGEKGDRRQHRRPGENQEYGK